MSRETDFTLYREIVLNIPFVEGVGSSWRDYASAHHPILLSGATPAWGFTSGGTAYISPDVGYPYIANAYTTDLQFVGKVTLSGVCWVYLVGAFSNQQFFGTRDMVTNGWGFIHDSSNGRGIEFRVGGANCWCAEGSRHTGTGWTLLGFSVYGDGDYQPRDRVVYCNGANITNQWTSVDSIVATTNPFYVGRRDAASEPWTSPICGLRIWKRKLTPSEHMYIFNSEREFFGV